MSHPADAGVTFKAVADEFEAAWNDPNHSRFELPAVAVNSRLREKYTVVPSVRMSRDKLWDMERKKAWDPASFIPYVVSEGKSWGRHKLKDGTERFFRASDQLGWIDNSAHGTVLEEVLIDNEAQRILFMGRAQFADGSGHQLHAGDFQPLFHVEHAAGGDDNDPLNLWRIVVLTKARDDRYTEPFRDMVRQGWLPGFVEIYIEREFNCKLTRRAA